MSYQAICLITYQPNKIWCDFLNQFQKYKIFLIIDDNNFHINNYENIYKNITFVRIENNKCNNSGFIDTNFTLNKLISGWDKALYYFGVENTNYDFIWFMEDDVYFYNENSLLNIDKQFIKADLLSSSCVNNIYDRKKDDWHWKGMKINYNPPYYRGMMCAVRMSKQLMKCITEYANKNKTLFFLEALFPTVAIKNNLKCAIPEELKEIHYRKNFEKEEIDKVKLFHPVKNINKHVEMREN
jgi:hypothetical protein